MECALGLSVFALSVLGITFSSSYLLAESLETSFFIWMKAEILT